MSLFELLLELKHEPFGVLDSNDDHFSERKSDDGVDNLMNKLLLDYEPENNYYEYRTDDLLIMAHSDNHGKTYLVTNYKLILVLLRGDGIFYHYAFAYSKIMDIMLNKGFLLFGGAFGCMIFIMNNVKQFICEELTFADFLPKLSKSASNFASKVTD